MNTRILISVLLCVSSSLVMADNEAMIKQSREAIKALATELKSELMTAMKNEGPYAAIKVCNIRAPEISKSISELKGFSVRRTSLKTRNLDNKPDEWERSVLKKFEDRKLKGEPVKTMEYSQVTEYKGKPAFRYMKAIPTGEPCLACHGENISPDINSKIKQMYPEDAATGFHAGDIRGAFTVVKPL